MGRCEGTTREGAKENELQLFVFLFVAPRSRFFPARPRAFSLALKEETGSFSLLDQKNSEKNIEKPPQPFELTDLSSPPLADDAAAARVLSRASESGSDAPVALWVVSSGTQALGGVAKVRN